MGLAGILNQWILMRARGILRDFVMPCSTILKIMRTIIMTVFGSRVMENMPTAWFPYLNQEDYLSPLMFIELTNPKRGVLISVECTAWARNIYHDRERQKGVGHFQIMID